jgi:Xaa-Pro aminopeptidase
MQERVHALQQRLQQRTLDALLVTEPQNRRYLSGYTAPDHGIQESSGVLLIPQAGRPFLLTDSRFSLQAQEETQGYTVEIYRKGLVALLKELLPALGLRNLAFESHYVLHSTAGKLERLAGELGLTLHPRLGLIERLREIKDAQEIQDIQASVALNEQVFQRIYADLRPGITEKELARRIEQTMQERGAEGVSFPPIVAFGSHAAKPHAIPTDRVLQRGDLVLIDMGLVLHGYCSDMTRTFVFGPADALFVERLRLVRAAQQAAVETIRAGCLSSTVDLAARERIAAAGYGDFFDHSLGHGVGLAVHEAPRLSHHSRKRLEAGMIVTVEPGIYLPEWGGIRLENMVLVQEEGCKVLNQDCTGLDI